MACTALSSAIFSPNRRVLTPKCRAPMMASSVRFSQPLHLSSNFKGLRKSFKSPRCRSLSSARCSVVRASAERPLVGNYAPDFGAEAVSSEGKICDIKLSNYRNTNYVILFFYPADFSCVCPTEITAFSDRYEEFKKLETEVIGVSVDSVYSHLAWLSTDRKADGLGCLPYPLVADVTKSISKNYNVLIPDEGTALRGTFIIDTEGVIQHSTINNLKVGRNVDEILRTLQALKCVEYDTDKFCPAGWKPGDEPLKSDAKLDQE